tara:strand:+ start:53132 stop:53989 length:858 start_codon:yes stop_codon:yes gene_type:complete
MKNKSVKIRDLEFNNSLEMILIAGPCQIESESHAFFICEKIKKISENLKIKFVFKSSYDKANRSSHKSSRGIGMKKGLKILENVKKKFNCPVLTDVHETKQCDEVSKVVDIIQIPAFLCRQTDLLIAAGKTNRVINIKKGQFMSPWEMNNAIEKVRSTGNNKILITERGTMFGYNNLITDIRSISILKKTGFPIIFDATHSVQLPGANSSSSGGQREFAEILAKASVTVGISAIFLETHQDPNNAPSDGLNMIPLSDLSRILEEIKLYDKLTKSIRKKNVRNKKH